MASLFGIGPKLGKEQELLDAARTGNSTTVERLLTKQDKGKKSTVGKLTRYDNSVACENVILDCHLLQYCV